MKKLLLATAILAVSTPSLAESTFSASIFGGVQYNGEISEKGIYEVGSTTSFATAAGLDYVSKGLTRTTAYGLFFSTTESDLSVLTVDDSDNQTEYKGSLKTDMYHLRVRAWGHSSSIVNTNLYGGLGVTSYSSGYGDDMHPSAHIGFGAVLPVNDHFAFRFDVTAFGTYLKDGTEAIDLSIADLSGKFVINSQALLGLEYTF